MDLAAERTMLEVDTQGQFRAIYYDDRSIAPLPLKGPRLKKYYAGLPSACRAALRSGAIGSLPAAARRSCPLR